MDSTHYVINRSMRDITGRAISVAASPNVVASAGSNIYPVLAPQNKIIDTDYKGDVNIMGNIPVSMMNSPESSYLQAFDLAHFPIGINYRYMALSPDDANIMLNRQVVAAMQEALSNAYAETFTDLGFFKAEYSPGAMGVPPVALEVDGDVPSKAATYLGPFMFYQTILQNVIMLDAKYKETMSLEQVLTDQAWLREVPQLKQMYGLLKKKTLISYFQALTSILPGNAVDVEWAEQVNVLCNIPSKRSDSYEDPLIIVDGWTKMPKEIIVSKPATTSSAAGVSWFYKYAQNVTTPPTMEGIASTIKSHYWAQFYAEDMDLSTGTKVQVGVCRSIEDLFFEVQSMLSPYSIAKTCRMIYKGEAPSGLITIYFNRLVQYLEAIIYCLKDFSSDFADMNVVLKVMQRVGLNNWRFGVTCKDNDRIPQYVPVYNKLLYDVFSAVLAGGAHMVWDDNSKRWKFWTTWSKTKDIPSYDLTTGGAFLTFSTRSIPPEEGMASKMKYCIPILFNPVQPYFIQFLNRDLIEVDLDSIEMSSTSLEANSVLSRLQAVRQPDLNIKVPIFEDTGNNNADGYMLKTLVNICGMAAMNKRGSDFGLNNIVETQLDPDLMNVLDIEMDDISNVMINQARVSAPFRVATPAASDQIGFMKVVS